MYSWFLYLFLISTSAYGLIVTNNSSDGDGDESIVTSNSSSIGSNYNDSRNYQYNDTNCDESKCVSWGLNQNFGYSVSCYTGHWYPMACSDGYVPWIVPTEEPVINSDVMWYMDTWLSSIQYGETEIQERYYYFTCCPPVPDVVLSDKMVGIDNNATNVTRHCSDPFDVSDEEIIISTNTTLCIDNVERPYPRTMAGTVGDVMCCDSNIENNNTEEERNYLNDIDCVQFRNNHDFRPAYQINFYGMIAPIYCHNQDEYHEFKYPRIINDPSAVALLSNNNRGILYECCKRESYPPILPFVKDTAFATTIYPQIAISIVAVVVCAIVIIALTPPLWETILCNKREGTSQSTIQSSSQEPSYSSYNLYLVYLNIPDLLLNVSEKMSYVMM